LKISSILIIATLKHTKQRKVAINFYSTDNDGDFGTESFKIVFLFQLKVTSTFKPTPTHQVDASNHFTLSSFL
jgi:hypothetical protein